jgi:adenylate cyclase
MAWSCHICSGTNPDGTRFCGLCGAARAAEAPAPSQRRLVTALFADISGFSELTNRLEPEQLLEIIDPAVTALSNVVGRYGGTIEKYAGDALMVLFGAPVAHDDDAARALRVAMEMHVELAQLVTRLPAAAAGLRLHVGVNSGHGIGRVIGSEMRLDYGVLGDVVVLAQRLEAAAPSGETYVGEATWRLTRKDFDYEVLGPLTVKGKDRPVAAWRLVGERRHRHATAPGARSGMQLVGRDGELAALGAAADRLADGHGGAVFVLGDPGLGKTRLCESVEERAAQAGWDWLRTRCLSYGGALPYWPFADLLRRLFGVGDLDAGEALSVLRSALAAAGLEEHTPFVGTLVGIEGTPPTDLAPQAFRRRLHESVLAILAARSASQPLILFVDDLQWADGPTMALIGDLAAATASNPILLLASARPEAAAAVDGLRVRIPDAALRLDLQPLGADAVATVAAGVLGAPAAPGLLAALIEHTRGNPFFVEEVTRSLVERGAVVPRGGTWQTVAGWDDAEVPLTVEGAVAARLDALPERERAALEVLAVVGRRAHLGLARAVAPGIEASLGDLVEAGILDRDPGDALHVLFHHPITQQVVYSRLLRRRRLELHRDVGRAAEALLGADDASVDLLARHFRLGGDPAHAYAYLVRSATRAELLYANDEAIASLGQAHEAAEAAGATDAERRELLLRRARLEEVRGTYDGALSLYDEVLTATGDVRAAVGKVSIMRKLGDYRQCLEVVRAARAAAPAEALLAGLALEEGRVLALMGDRAMAVGVMGEALTELAGRDRGLEGQLLIGLAQTEALLGAVDPAREHASEAARRFEADGDLGLLAFALRVLGGIQGSAAGPGDLEGLRKARENLERALALARRVGDAEESAASLVNLGMVLSELGLRKEALRCDWESIDAFATVGLKAGIACGYCNLAEHLGLDGRWDESMEAARAGLAIAREIGNEQWITGGLLGIAEAYVQHGEHEQASAAAEEALARALAIGHPGRVETAFRHAVAARRGLGDDEGAEELLDRQRALEASNARSGG